MDFDVLDEMDFEDLEVVETWRDPMRHRVRANPFDELEEEEFRYKYRFTKRFASSIVDLVKNSLPHDPRGASLSPQIQVACALRCWARHEIQDDTADLHGISQPAVSIICKNVAEALARLSQHYIRMPASIHEENQNMAKFRAIANFPGVIAAIDCTHIRIRKISTDDGQLYINRKGYPSMNVQAVCNADLKIMDIVARWRGSVHDSRIFRECRLKQRFDAGAFQGILLGDSGYPCTSYLLTPLLHPTTPQEERYNMAHIRTRNTIERCFGLWKQRFRCLLRGMFCSIETAKKIIVACAVLHNIDIDMRVEIFPDAYPDEEINPGSYPSSTTARTANTLRGNIRRRQFIENYF